MLGEAANSAGGEVEQLVELTGGKRLAFGGRLNFDEAATAGHDHVHIDFGAGIFLIAEVQHGVAEKIPTLVAATESERGTDRRIPVATMRSKAIARGRRRLR